MTELERGDRAMVERLIERAGTRSPAYAEEAIAATTRVRQRPWWTFPGRWLPLERGAAIGHRWLIVAAVVALTMVAALLAWAASRTETVPRLTGNGLIAVTTYGVDAGGPLEIVLVDPATGEVAPESPTWPGAAFGFSPDGTRLLYLVPTPETWDAQACGGALWVAAIDGEGAVPVTTDLGRVTAASWSPDGRRIVVAFLDGTSRTRIGIVAADGSGMRVLDLGGPADSPSWDPAGRRVLFRGLRDTHRALYTVAVDDPRDIREVVGLDDAASYSGIEPEAAWSPDGRWVAYVRLIPGNGSRTTLHVVSVDGSLDRVLPVESHASIAMRPRWSPDGRRIVARTSQRLMVVDVEGGRAWPVGPKLPHQDLSLRNFSWSPDGRLIVAGALHTQLPWDDAIRYVDPRIALIDPDLGSWTDAGRGLDQPLVGPAQTIAWQAVDD